MSKIEVTKDDRHYILVDGIVKGRIHCAEQTIRKCDFGRLAVCRVLDSTRSLKLRITRNDA